MGSLVAASHVPTVAMFIRWYEIQRNLLQAFVHWLSLPSALTQTYEFHKLNGFIKDELQAAEPHTFRDPVTGLSFRALFNARRRERHAGSGKKHPPMGFDSVYDGCFLAPGNVMWQQCGSQIPYTLLLAGHEYNFLVQPFPFGPLHFTVALSTQAPQDWRPDLHMLAHRIRVMRAIAEALEPGFAVLFNGKGAGSSIDWEHFHVLAAGRLPVQDAARLGVAWPLPFHRIAGSEDGMAEEVMCVAGDWQKRARERATECIAMVREEEGVVCYYFPRDRQLERGVEARFAGRVGAYECCGVFVFEQDEEGRALREGRKGFADLWRILADVCPPMEE